MAARLRQVHRMISGHGRAVYPADRFTVPRDPPEPVTRELHEITCAEPASRTAWTGPQKRLIPGQPRRQCTMTVTILLFCRTYSVTPPKTRSCMRE